MSRKVEMIGRRFGRLVVTAEEGRVRKEIGWRCVCDCGKTIVSAGFNLRSGNTTSCGCFKAEVMQGLMFKPRHGMGETRIHGLWLGMLQRCLNPNSPAYPRYGGRGITVCERWRTFENFYADMGPRPDGLTLERIDSNGNYEPANCKWATWAEQTRNTSRNRWIEFNGQRKCLIDWANETGIKSSTLLCRFASGWTLEESLTIPVSAPWMVKPKSKRFLDEKRRRVCSVTGKTVYAVGLK